MVPLALPLSMFLLSAALVVGAGLDRPLLRETDEKPTPIAAAFVPQPTCAAPRPSVVSRQDLPQALLLLQLQLAAQAVEEVPAPVPQQELPAEVQTLLTQWQHASGRLLPPTREAQQRLLHQHRGALNGHQISLLVQFSGPVERAALCERYRWSVARRNAQTVELIAEPQDEVERLFCRRCTVTLNAGSGLPASVVFEGGAGAAATVAVQTLQDVEPELTQPRAPKPLILTAKLAGETFVPAVEFDSGSQDGSGVPELAELPENVRRMLLRWEAASTRRGPLHLRVKQTLLEKATGQQRHAEGDLHFDDRHDYRLKLTDDRGATLVVTADGATRFVPDAAAEDATAEILKQPAPEVIAVSAEAPIERNPLPELALLHASLPFTLNLDAVHLASQFAWALDRQDAAGSAARSIVLRGVPKTDAARRHYRRVEVVLDGGTFRTLTTRVVLANGDERTQTLTDETVTEK